MAWYRIVRKNAGDTQGLLLEIKFLSLSNLRLTITVILPSCRLVSSLACARAREMLFKTWDKNDRKDTSVILYLMEQGLSSPFFDPLLNKMMDISGNIK